MTDVPEVAIRGLSLGLLQWLILRRYIAQAHRWMWATTGVAVVASVGYPVVQFSLEAIFFTFDLEGFAKWLIRFGYLFVWGATVVVLTGVMQWLVLRRQVPRAGWWIAASFAAYFFGIVASIVSADMGMSLPVVPYDLFPFPLLIGVAVFALITGAVLAWLLRQPAAGGRTAAA